MLIFKMSMMNYQQLLIDTLEHSAYVYKLPKISKKTFAYQCIFENIR